MRLDVAWSRARAWDPWIKTAVTTWTAVVLVVAIRAVVQPRAHSLYYTYATAGGDWVAGSTLYRTTVEPNLEAFRYSPVVAALLVPFHYLPETLGGVLWRLFNAGALLGGLLAWLRCAVPGGGVGGACPPHISQVLTRRQQGLLFLFAVPLSLSSLNNAQPNPLVIGLLLATAAAAARDRWNWAALFMALAGVLKVYPLAVGLLIAAAYPRRFALRLALALVLFAALPYLLQRPEYVSGQYVEWYQRLGNNDRRYWPLHMTYRDLWLLFRVSGLTVSGRAYLGVQLASAAGCALLCVAGRRRGWYRRQVLWTALALGSCWMMLCGPATESCTYVLLAPALAWALVRAGAEPWPAAARRLPAVAFGLLLIGVLAGATRITSRIHALGPQPLGALVLTAGYVITTVRALASPPAAAQADPPNAARAA